MARLSGALRDEPARERRATLSAQAVEMARRLGDSATLAYALDGRYSAIWAPDTAEQRLAIADEIVALAEEIGDSERAFQGRHYRLSVLMEIGDVPAMKLELERNARAAEALHQPAQRWLVAVTIALLALFEGRFDQAESLMEDAYDHGRRAESVHALGALRLQEYALRREQGRAAEMEKPLAELTGDYWFWPWTRTALAHLHAELGHAEEARHEFDASATARFDDWPLDNDWLLGLTLFADVCTFLGDVHHAATLYALLSPYEKRNTFGHPEFSTGSVARSLANLASTMGRLDDAERHFATALESNMRMGARPWVAHTRHDHAVMLLTRGTPTDRARAITELHQAAEIAEALGQVALERKVAAVLASIGVDRVASAKSVPDLVEASPSSPNVFRRDGDYWLVAFDGHESRSSRHEGPQAPRHADRKFGDGDPCPRSRFVTWERTSSRAVRRTADHGPSSGRHDTGAVIDDRARRAYRERIEELQAAIDEAEAWNDSERAACKRATNWSSWPTNSPRRRGWEAAFGGWARTRNGRG